MSVTPRVDDDSVSAADRPSEFVAFSEIRVVARGAEALIGAFNDRLGEVEDWPGFSRLEVWQDEGDDGRFAMVSWWADRASFTSYMRSRSHRRSHERIVDGENRPRPASFSRFRIVAR